MQASHEPQPAGVIAKQQLRDAAAAMREKAHAEEGAEASSRLVRAGVALFDRLAPAIVSGFVPYRSEIDTRPLLEALAEKGWTIALPVVIGAGRALEFRQWRREVALVPGRWNIPIPPEGEAVVSPDILLVPMLAFDRAGYRLGYGGGFYDRSLEALRATKPVMAIGVAYAAQEVAAVPHEDFDQRLDRVLTPSGVIDIETEREHDPCG